MRKKSVSAIKHTGFLAFLLIFVEHLMTSDSKKHIGKVDGSYATVRDIKQKPLQGYSTFFLIVLSTHTFLLTSPPPLCFIAQHVYKFPTITDFSKLFRS